MSEQNLDRDSDYRIAALHEAIYRISHDGGLESPVDVLGLANVYYQWLSGKTDLKDPINEKEQK